MSLQTVQHNGGYVKIIILLEAYGNSKTGIRFSIFNDKIHWKPRRDRDYPGLLYWDDLKSKTFLYGADRIINSKTLSGLPRLSKTIV